MSREFIISNEDDAYEVLKTLMDEHLDPSKFTIELKGWPTINLHLTGDKYHQTITPSMMKGFLELQKGIYRSYALTKYKSPNTNKLTKAERDELEIEVKVSNGSSNYDINLQSLLEKFISTGVDKMDGSQIVVVILGVFLTYAGSTAFRYYLDTRRQEKEQEVASAEKLAQLDTMKKMSEEETERTKILAQLVRQNATFDNVQRTAYDTTTELLKSMRNADAGSFQGIEITGSQADLITQNARRKSSDVRLDGRYRILSVDSSHHEDFKVKVRDIDSGDTFNAKVQDDSLTDTFLKRLQKAEWEKKPVELKINAKEKDNIISAALVIDVQQVIEPE
ncbi:MAG: hypothetical protein ACPGMR_02775 [Pontibacterium sp.]